MQNASHALLQRILHPMYAHGFELVKRPQFPKQLSASLHNRAIELRIDYTVLSCRARMRAGSAVSARKAPTLAHVRAHV